MNFVFLIISIVGFLAFREFQHICFISHSWWDTEKTSRVLTMLGFMLFSFLCLGALPLIGVFLSEPNVSFMPFFIATIVSFVIVARKAHRVTMLECANLIQVWCLIDKGFGDKIDRSDTRLKTYFSWLRAGGMPRQKAEEYAITLCG